MNTQFPYTWNEMNALLSIDNSEVNMCKPRVNNTTPASTSSRSFIRRIPAVHAASTLDTNQPSRTRLHHPLPIITQPEVRPVARRGSSRTTRASRGTATGGSGRRRLGCRRRRRHTRQCRRDTRRAGGSSSRRRRSRRSRRSRSRTHSRTSPQPRIRAQRRSHTAQKPTIGVNLAGVPGHDAAEGREPFRIRDDARQRIHRDVPASRGGGATRHTDEDLDVLIERDGLGPVIPGCEVEVILG